MTDAGEVMRQYGTKQLARYLIGSRLALIRSSARVAHPADHSSADRAGLFGWQHVRFGLIAMGTEKRMPFHMSDNRVGRNNR
jgi:hypothetical protein